MPILALFNEIEIELTHDCNWNCPYCAIKTHEQEPISIQQMMQKVKSIPSNSIVTLSGGEPGILYYKDIYNIINILKRKKCILNLNTNGLFLKKYSNLLLKFNQIIYHCTQNLDINDKIIQIDNINIRYMIVVTDDNICKLKTFLNAYPNIIFDIVQATYDIQTNQPILSAKNRNMIITKFANRMTKESIKRMFHEKNWNIMKFI